MKSIAITIAAYSIATAFFFASIPTTTSKTTESNDYPAATGIMLQEVVISSLPTCTLPEVVVSTKSILEYTLPEVVIIGEKPKA